MPYHPLIKMATCLGFTFLCACAPTLYSQIRTAEFEYDLHHTDMLLEYRELERDLIGHRTRATDLLNGLSEEQRTKFPKELPRDLSDYRMSVADLLNGLSEEQRTEFLKGFPAYHLRNDPLFSPKLIERVGEHFVSSLNKDQIEELSNLETLYERIWQRQERLAQAQVGFESEADHINQLYRELEIRLAKMEAFLVVARNVQSLPVLNPPQSFRAPEIPRVQISAVKLPSVSTHMISQVPRMTPPLYLGCLNCSQYDPNSIWNPYSRYGSPYSPDSIWNPYGEYGRLYSPKSPWNRYTLEAPLVFNSHGQYRGKLGGNPFDPDSLSNPYGRFGDSYSFESPLNPYAPDSLTNTYSTDPLYLFGK